MSALLQAKGRPVAPDWFPYAGEFRRLPSRRGQRCQINAGTPDGGGDCQPFTREEHLRVQTQIEQRAYEIWLAGGCRPESPLCDWLKAESEVLQEFCLSRQSLAPF